MCTWRSVFAAAIVIGSMICAAPALRVEARPEAVDDEIPRFKESHPSAITSLALSADGRRALTGMKDGAIWLWDVEGGTLLRRCQGPKEPITCLAFSPDGKRWLSGDKQGIVVQWDTESGREIHRYEGHRDAIEALLVPKNSKAVWLLSVGGGADATLRRWDPEKCVEVEQRRLSKTTAHLYAAAIASDGKSVACGYATTVRLWDSSGKELAKLDGHKGRVLCMAFSPDGKFVASGSKDKTVRIWDVAGKREHRIHEGHKGAVTSVSFSADGQRLLSGGDDHTVRLWDVNKQEIHCFEGDSGEVSGVAFTPDGKFALSSSHDKTLRMWRLPK
jgi:WD40 repeat protein